jgi:hypothetical protein
MKRIITLLAAGLALLLTGCATNYDAYAKAQSEIAVAQSNAETSRLVALARIAESGDAGAKIGAVMALAFSGQRASTQLHAPGDPVLEWVKALAGPLTNVWGIVESNRTARHSSDNAVKTQQITFGALENIAVKGMDEAGKVTIPPVYTVPMGSAPASTADPIAPADPVAPTTPIVTP